MKNRNVTGLIVALIYCFGLYAILMDAPEGEAPNHPLWVYTLIPLGATVISFLFERVIKFDFFKKKK
ncbi:hypothetical protein [Paenibacillus pini]|uniref:Uncharacterized protein n=1 Tax=Paenibacillus pini JCM 16418 TaxID=1236976 RepID=W7YJW8_9BACL|nr:hypothetical protein [Paenibacillus pini]GAF07983.1 hypothetical protein JCM16418_2017 [Paenibacillus pini JCM 16418]